MNVLEKIVAAKMVEVSESRARISLADVRKMAADQPAPKNFIATLLNSAHPVSLIAEVKRQSPVKGVIRPNFDPLEVANAYLRAGADCLSVLTDRNFFGGAPEFLNLCKEATGLPALRKDFILDEYQVYESRAIGADAILLIVSALDKAPLTDLQALSESLGMDVLVEVHTPEEAEVAIAARSKAIGINNRDLETFETRLDFSQRILPMLPENCLGVSESAIRSAEDVRQVQAAGARAVLIGTTFCSADDVEAKVLEVMGW